MTGDADEPTLRRCRPGDIAILLPARTSLPMLERELTGLAVPYRAENASVVYTATEIRHVMLTLRAAADPTDQLALVAALRSPLYGCSDVELYDWKQGGGRWNIFAPAPEHLAEHPVAVALAHIRTLAETGRSGRPARAGRRRGRGATGARSGAGRLGCPRRVAAGSIRHRPGPSLDRRRRPRPAALPAVDPFQAAEGRASDTILPERDHDAVRIMTVHAAKGLEFPITIVAGLTTRNQGADGSRGVAA